MDTQALSSPISPASTELDDPLADPLTETLRIMRTGSLWTAAGILAPALALGPMLAAGWRPGDLPLFGEAIWWIGAVAAGIGLALLIWAGCPVPAYALPEAHTQKVFSIRFGIVLNAAGMALCGLAILLSPVTG